MKDHGRILFRGSLLGTIIIGFGAIVIRWPILIVVPFLLAIFYGLGLLVELVLPAFFWTTEAFYVTPEEFARVTHSHVDSDRYNLKIGKERNYFGIERYYMSYNRDRGFRGYMQFSDDQYFTLIKNYKLKQKFDIDLNKKLG